MIDQLISELVAYGLQNGLIEDADKVYVTNGLLELFQKQDYQEPNASVEPRDLHFILEDMLAFALSEGILEDDTVTMKDLFDTKIMGILTPAPSVVRKISGISKDCNRLLLSFQPGNKLYPHRPDYKG